MVLAFGERSVGKEFGNHLAGAGDDTFQRAGSELRPVGYVAIGLMAVALVGGLVRQIADIMGRHVRDVGVRCGGIDLDGKLPLDERLARQGDLPIKNVALQSGFRDPLYFSRLFKKRFGVSPTRYQKANSPAREGNIMKLDKINRFHNPHIRT